MTGTDFDEVAWIRRLGAALEDIAASATPKYAPLPPMPMGIRPIGEYDSALRLGYQRLAVRAKHDRTAGKQFNESHLPVLRRSRSRALACKIAPICLIP